MNEDEGNNKGNRKSLFSMDNIVMGLLLSGMVWGGNQIVSIKEVQATLITQQNEDKRVNEIVYEAIPEIRNAIVSLSKDGQYQSERMDGLFTVVSNMNQTITNPQHGSNAMTNSLIIKYGKAPETE